MRTTPDVGIEDILFTLLENEHEARRTLNLVASENAMSGLAKLPLLLDTYHRYFFNERHDSEGWNFRGGARAAALETGVTLPLLRELAAARFATIRPLSGLSAMSLVLAGMGGPVGSTIATVATENGGHYATAGIARRFGLDLVLLRGPDPHEIDFEGAAALVAETRPTLIYVDQSNCLFPLDVARLAEHVRRVDDGILIHVDVSHWLGLVLGGAFPNPLACGADSFGGSTHKTFPGPQKAIFCTNRIDVAERVQEAQDFLISSHHFGASLSLGLALTEFRDYGGVEYAHSILDNTLRFGQRLHDHGVPVVAADRGFSAGHQLWLDTEAEGIPARVASDRLYQSGIRVNFQPLPGLARPAVRVGLNEATYRGLRGAEMDILADIFVDAMRATMSPSVLAERTATLRESCRPSPAFPLWKDPLLETAIRLCMASLLDIPPFEVDDASVRGAPALRGHSTPSAGSYS